MHPVNMHTVTANKAGPSGIPNPVAWKFLDEPLWRWLVFLVAMNLMISAWNGVIRLMK